MIMCRDCLDEYGVASSDPSPYPDISKAIANLYLYHPTGGPMHCELDDYNLEDYWFRQSLVSASLRWREWHRQWDDSACECTPLLRRIYVAMSGMTTAQRALVVWHSER